MHYLDSGNGNTTDSLAFFNHHRQLLGDIVQAQLFAPHHEGPSPYTCVLTDDRGNTIWLSGLGAGYSGEGPRRAMETLLDCGFSTDQAKEVLRRSPVRLQRQQDHAAPAVRDPWIAAGPPRSPSRSTSLRNGRER